MLSKINFKKSFLYSFYLTVLFVILAKPHTCAVSSAGGAEMVWDTISGP